MLSSAPGEHASRGPEGRAPLCRLPAGCWAIGAEHLPASYARDCAEAEEAPAAEIFEKTLQDVPFFSWAEGGGKALCTCSELPPSLVPSMGKSLLDPNLGLETAVPASSFSEQLGAGGGGTQGGGVDLGGRSES